ALPAGSESGGVLVTKRLIDLLFEHGSLVHFVTYHRGAMSAKRLALHIETERLRLRVWGEADRDHFAALNADPIVMNDLGGPLSRDDSEAKLDRYLKAWRSHGYGRWLIETITGEFLGYCGVMPVRGDHPIGIHDEIGWRLIRRAWGHGYATEAARAALIDVFRRVKLIEVLAYTDAQN